MRIPFRFRAPTRAYKNLFEASWVYAWKSGSYALLAMLAAGKGEFALALEHAEESLLAGGGNHNALWIKAVALRKLGRCAEARTLLEAAIACDPLDLQAAYELALLSGDPLDALRRTADKPEYAIDVAARYALAGCYDEAVAILSHHQSELGAPFAPLLYHLGYAHRQAGNGGAAMAAYTQAAALDPVGCLHSRPESLLALRDAIESNPTDACAPYYLGNMLYGARQHDMATALFEESVARGAKFPTAYRNLSYGLFRRGDTARAGDLIRTAFEMDETDNYVFFDLCQYLRNTNAPIDERIALYERHIALAKCGSRDDNYNMMCAAYIEKGDYAKAQRLLRGHNYHSYEGGEGVSARLHIQSMLLDGIEALQSGDAARALDCFEQATVIPENFHEGARLDPFMPFAENAHIDYWRGRANELLGNADAAKTCYEAAVADPLNVAEMKYYAAQALRKLGRQADAESMAKALLADAELAAASAGQYQYFRSAASYLPYEGDKRRKDMELARYLTALALLANGKREEARAALKEAAAQCALDYKSAFIVNHFDLYK